MKELLIELNTKYDLKLGKKQFSPVMQCSVGLAMQYRELVMDGLHSPFHLNFPDKQNAALWLSVALLRNYLLEDYINQSEDRIEDLDLKVGEKIEIFGAVATFGGLKREKLLLNFKKQDSPIEISHKLAKYVNRTTKRENRYRVFGRNRKAAWENRNAISKLLEPDDPIYINEAIFESKVLVVAGRGNTGDFTNRLKGERLYETPLSDIFNSGENIIIKPDLEDFKFLTEQDNNDQSQYFENNFLRFKEELLDAVPERKEDIHDLIEKVENSAYRNHDFIKLYREILDEIDNDKLNRISEFFPGVKENLPENLKSVVLNDISQVKHYEGLLKEFLKRKIPVLVLSNRFTDDKKAIYFFDEYFSNHSDELRINWNKSKIEALKKNKPSSKILDKKLWQKCLKFSNQTIEIHTTKSHPSDAILTKLQRKISNLEGQERLIKAYWQIFNPLIYSFKNGSKWKPYHEALINEFLQVFDEIKITLNSETRELLEELLDSLRRTKDNYKKIDPRDNIFIQSLEINGQKQYFPETAEYITNYSQINDDIKQITFTGFPLNEHWNKQLINSISDFLTENIKLICWPKEGAITYSYIRRRLKAGYFLDKIPSDWQLNKNLLILSEKDISDEIDTTLFSNISEERSTEDSEKDESALEDISVFKYSAYKSSNSGDTDYSVKCNIIDLENGAFMFLPMNGKVLAKIETEGDEFNFRRAGFRDLKEGDEIFQYYLPRHKLRILSRNVEGSDVIFNDLDIWKKSLYETFEKCERDIKKLLKLLKKINEQHGLNASPTYQNLRNWLFDEDMHSPEEENLRMILLADPDETKIQMTPKILKAKKIATSISRKISYMIKKSILKKMNKLDTKAEMKFTIMVYGITLLVEFRKILNLHPADGEFEYKNTRKIIE
jgi:hypothetical protein